MKKIYIDLRYAYSVSKTSGKFNGGNSYSKIMTNKLLSCEDTEIYIIADNAEIIQEEFNIASDKIIDFGAVRQLDNIVYFNPLISDSYKYYKELRFLKKNNFNIEIKLTIHDRRHHENIFDSYNGVLEKGIRRNWIVYGLGRLMNMCKKDYAVKQIINQADEIYTVSNYSMQELLNCGNPKKINYFTNSSLLKTVDDYADNNYILFVSAGRSEKNFVRALKAFEMYVKKFSDNNVRLKVTGLDNRQKRVLKDKNIIDDSILNNQVDLLGYVDNNELSKLYANCKFLLFTSKSEGFGMPVAEAMLFNKPTVASRLSSIPEVMGSAAIYVDPYSVKSICYGIAEMMNEDTYSKYLEYVKVKREIWRKQVILDNEILIRQIVD